MYKIFKFFLSIIFFIPKIILDSIFSVFKLMILMVVILVALYYGGNYYVKNFFSTAYHTYTKSDKK